MTTRKTTALSEALVLTTRTMMMVAMIMIDGGNV